MSFKTERKGCLDENGHFLHLRAAIHQETAVCVSLHGKTYVFSPLNYISLLPGESFISGKTQSPEISWLIWEYLSQWLVLCTEILNLAVAQGGEFGFPLSCLCWTSLHCSTNNCDGPGWMDGGSSRPRKWTVKAQSLQKW